MSFSKLYIKGVRRLHFLVLMALFVPFFCRITTLGLDEQAAADAVQTFIPLYVLSLSIVLPAAMIYLIQEKASSIWTFLICACPMVLIYLSLLFWADNALGLNVNGSEKIPQALIVLMYLLDAIRMRTNDNSRKKSKDDNDLSWVGDQYLLPLPALQFLLLFALFYVLALLFHSHELSFTALIGSIMYFFLVLPYLMLLHREEYLENRHNVHRIPTELIARLQGISMARVLIPCSLVAIAALMTSSGRRFLDLPKIVFESSYTPFRYHPLPRCGLMRVLKEMEIGKRGGPPPQWLMDLLEFVDNIVAMLILALIAYAFYRGIKGIVVRFNYKNRPDSPLTRKVQTTDEHISLKKERKRFTFREPSNSIRRRYKKTILHYRKEAPEIHETPSRIEALAGLPDTPQMRILHDEYEAARYGRSSHD